jgi:hypothetical protein
LKCVACISGCSTCSSPTSCQLCTAPQLSQNGTCVARCAAGYYSSGSTCQVCGAGCSFCAKANACLVCNPGFYSYLGNCYVNCGGNQTIQTYGTIASTNDSTCVACNAPC